MRIFIFGNLNSGKTRLARQLLTHLPEYAYLALDEFRVNHSDGSLEGEQKAVTEFVDSVIKQPNTIIEFSGYGSAANLLKQHISTCGGIMLVCTRKHQDCINDINPAKYAAVPYPQEYKQAESLAETIQRLSTLTTEKNLREEWQSFIWQSYEVPFEVSTDSLIDRLAFEHHKIVHQMKCIAFEHQDFADLVVYGSMGANSLTPNSDLDFYIRTALSPDAIQSILKPYFSKECVHSDLLDKKITLRMRSGLLVEVMSGQTLRETALYYRESQIKSVRSTVLKGDEITIQQLEQFIQQQPIISEMTAPIAAELYFLFCSLPKLKKVGDSYKYAFHIYIIQHCAIQLESLLTGNLKHNYLPKQAAESLPYFPWDCFTVSPIEINSCQYNGLQGYLQQLFLRLEENQLIETGKYFTLENMGLH